MELSRAVEEDREIVDGDWAEIEFKGVIQELATTVGEEPEAAEPIIGEDVLIEVGGANTLPAFSEALRGKKVGQEMEFEVTYPADFGEPRLANQTVKYDVTLKTIKKKTFPEKDEEFAKQLGEYDSWSDFRDQAARDGGRPEEGHGRESREGEDGRGADCEVPIPRSGNLCAAADRRAAGPRAACACPAGHDVGRHAQARLSSGCARRSATSRSTK